MKKISLAFSMVLLLAGKDNAQTDRRNSSATYNNCLEEDTKFIHEVVRNYGGRYYFSEDLTAQVEIGWGITWLTVGSKVKS